MIMKKLVLFTLALSLLLFFAGCQNTAAAPAADPVNIVFVLGIADGESVVAAESIRELAALPSQPGSSYAFVSVESSSAPIGESDVIADLTDRGYTEDMMKRVRQGIRADLNGRVASYVPSTAEIDLAAAVTCAVRLLNTNAAPGRRNVLVFWASGRSSTGLIDLSETPISRLDVDASVPVIAEQMHTDMSSVDQVVWYSCGDCGGTTQSAPSAGEQAKLREFYGKLFQTLGAKDVDFRDDLPNDGFYSFPETPVTRMETETVCSGLKELKAATPEVLEQTALQEALVIPESMVKFRPDSAEFLDQAGAEAAIRPVSNYLLQHEELRILLYGTCAGDSDSDSAVKLARSRAEHVMEVLVSAGVAPSRVQVISVSVYDDPYYQFGLGTGSAASVNRKCVLMDLRSAEAEKLLALEKP